MLVTNPLIFHDFSNCFIYLCWFQGLPSCEVKKLLYLSFGLLEKEDYVNIEILQPLHGMRTLVSDSSGVASPSQTGFSKL